MANELVIQRWGNSAAVRLPVPLLEQLKVHVGDRLTTAIGPEGLMLSPAKPKYALQELLGQCDPAADMPADLAHWQGMSPVGREAW